MTNSKIKEYGLHSQASSIENSILKNSLISEKSVLTVKKRELQKEIQRLQNKKQEMASLNSSVCSKRSGIENRSLLSKHYLEEYERKNQLYHRLKQKYDNQKTDYVQNCLNKFYSNYRESSSLFKEKF